MLRSVEKLYGFEVQASDGDAGKVDDLFFDDKHWTVRYIVVNTGTWLLGRQVLIVPSVADKLDWTLRLLPVRLTKEMVKTSPEIDLHKPVSSQKMEELHEHYGWPTYWAGSPLLGTPSLGAYPMLWADTKTESGPDEAPRGDPHLRSIREVTGYHVEAKDGEIGHVSDFFVDEDDWAIRYLLVDTRDWLPGRKVLLAPQWIQEVDWGDAHVLVNLTRQKVKDGPQYDPDSPPTRSYEAELYRHYGWPGYWP
jgi:sporulation protein YlmC with PRC-barrel domain